MMDFKAYLYFWLLYNIYFDFIEVFFKNYAYQFVENFSVVNKRKMLLLYYKVCCRLSFRLLILENKYIMYKDIIKKGK